jgi:hypothetical protein
MYNKDTKLIKNNQLIKIIYFFEPILKKSKKYKYHNSDNENININIIKNINYINWDVKNLSKNPNITWDIIQNNQDIKWNYTYLSENPNIIWDIVKNNPDKKWDYGNLSRNPNITYDIVKDNPDKKWDYGNLSRNPNINLNIMENNTNNFFNINTDLNKYIDDDIIINYKEPMLDYDYILSNNKYMNENILKYYNKCNWYYLLKNNNLDINYNNIINYINKKVNVEEIYKNNIEFNDIDEIDDKIIYINECYFFLSQNHNITWDIVKDNLDKPWDFYFLSENPNITWDIIKNNPNKKWSIKNYISNNPNLKLNDIKEIIPKIPNKKLVNLFYMCTENKFEYHNYFISPIYKKQLVNNFINKCKEELINKVCTPKRILNWNEDVLLNNDHPLFGLKQKDINNLIEI